MDQQKRQPQDQNQSDTDQGDDKTVYHDIGEEQSGKEQPSAQEDEDQQS